MSDYTDYSGWDPREAAHHWRATMDRVDAGEITLGQANGLGDQILPPPPKAPRPAPPVVGATLTTELDDATRAMSMQLDIEWMPLTERNTAWLDEHAEGWRNALRLSEAHATGIVYQPYPPQALDHTIAEMAHGLGREFSEAVKRDIARQYEPTPPVSPHR